MDKTSILAIIASGSLICSCSSGSEEAILSRQASRIDSIAIADAAANPDFVKSANATYADKTIEINVAFADSAINVTNYTQSVINYFTAEQLKAHADKNLEETVNALAHIEGGIRLELNDVYGNNADFNFTANELKFLIKSQRSRINFAEAKQNVIDLMAGAADKFGCEGASAIDFDLTTGFATYTVTFPSAKSYANLTVGNLKARYMPMLSKRYASFGNYKDAIYDMLKSLGIEGYRIVYTTADNNAPELKAAIPWREI